VNASSKLGSSLRLLPARGVTRRNAISGARGAVMRVGKWRALAVGQATCLDGALEFSGIALPKVMSLN
jgi:hypothetical protein